MKITVSALTTIDNPYDPFTEWDAWYGYDQANGHFSCEYLARSVVSANANSELEQIQTVNRAIDDIVRLNATGYWRKVTREEDIDVESEPL